MPAPYRRIACFIEESAASDLALDEALSIRAQSPGAELHVVHVAMRPHPLWVGMYGSIAARSVTTSRPPITGCGMRVADVPDATPHLLEGWPPRAACQYAVDADIDLMVAAAHRGLVDRAMLGGFAAYVAYHAPCSVLLVHPPVAAEGAGDEGERPRRLGLTAQVEGASAATLRSTGPPRAASPRRAAPRKRHDTLSGGLHRGVLRAVTPALSLRPPARSARMKRPPSPSHSQPRSTGSKGMGATGAPSSWEIRRATASACWQAIPPCLTAKEPASPTTKASGRPATRPSAPALMKPCGSQGRPGIAGPRCSGSATTRLTSTAPSRISSSRPHDQPRTIAPARSAIPARTRSSATASDVRVPNTLSGASSAVTRVRKTASRTPRRRSRRSVWRASS